MDQYRFIKTSHLYHACTRYSGADRRSNAISLYLWFFAGCYVCVRFNERRLRANVIVGSALGEVNVRYSTRIGRISTCTLTMALCPLIRANPDQSAIIHVLSVISYRLSAIPPPRDSSITSQVSRPGSLFSVPGSCSTQRNPHPYLSACAGLRYDCHLTA